MNLFNDLVDRLTSENERLLCGQLVLNLPRVLRVRK